MERLQATGKIRKRKAESQDNERLSKRMSLLNLERDGSKLYVPVEQPNSSSSKLCVPVEQPTSTSTSKLHAPAHPRDEDVMLVDDTKHKVYIYDLDAELSDSGESDDGKLVFLPDIEKHLRESRIPPSIRANSDGELAGNNQLVLYNVPVSLTVPAEKDSVRKAIIETRARARAKQDGNRKDDTPETPTIAINGNLDARDWYSGMINGTIPKDPRYQQSIDSQAGAPMGNGMATDDPDAMDLG